MSICCLRQLSTEAVKKTPKAFMQSELLNLVNNYHSSQKMALLLNGYVLGGGFQLHVIFKRKKQSKAGYHK